MSNDFDDRDGLDDAATPQGRLLYSRLTKHVRLRQLQLLVALQQCGSVVQAAATLHMSQSAATQALAEMERVLDIRLFERHARGIRPTLAGQTLVDTVRGVLAALEEVAESLAAIRRGAAAALRLGAIPAAALAILSPLLARFYAEHPEVHVDVHEDASTRLLSQLLGGGLDAVFCREPALLPGPFAFEPLLADTAVVVAARSHALAGRRGVPLQALTGARWVLPTANIAVRGIFEAEVLQALPDAPLQRRARRAAAELQIGGDGLGARHRRRCSARAVGSTTSRCTTAAQRAAGSGGHGVWRLACQSES